MKEGYGGDPEAWTVEPLADDEEASTLFLSDKQRQLIIAAASPCCADFLRAIEFTGGRPGELAAATVADLNVKTAALTLKHKKGRPAKLRPRAVSLSDTALAFFKKHTRGKTPAAPLLTQPDGTAWGRHKWSDEVQKAIASVNSKAKGKARIPKGASAYSYRHARISELLQDYGIDPLTVAHQTGTSVRMIERSYFKFIATTMREKLNALEGKQ
jgi:integrase